MKPISNQRGALPVLAIVLVVVLIVVAGIAAYAGIRTPKNNPTLTSSASPTSSPVANASPMSNVFVVKELGIRFTVTDDIKDLTYNVRTAMDGAKIADFSTASLTATGGKYCAANQDAPLGSIVLNSDPNYPSGRVKQLGSGYLFWSHSQSQCSQDANVTDLANKQTASFRSALDSAQLNP